MHHHAPGSRHDPPPGRRRAVLRQTVSQAADVLAIAADPRQTLPAISLALAWSTYAPGKARESAALDPVMP